MGCALSRNRPVNVVEETSKEDAKSPEPEKPDRTSVVWAEEQWKNQTDASRVDLDAIGVTVGEDSGAAKPNGVAAEPEHPDVIAQDLVRVAIDDALAKSNGAAAEPEDCQAISESVMAATIEDAHTLLASGDAALASQVTDDAIEKAIEQVLAQEDAALARQVTVDAIEKAIEQTAKEAGKADMELIEAALGVEVVRNAITVAVEADEVKAKAIGADVVQELISSALEADEAAAVAIGAKVVQEVIAMAMEADAEKAAALGKKVVNEVVAIALQSEGGAKATPLWVQAPTLSTMASHQVVSFTGGAGAAVVPPEPPPDPPAEPPDPKIAEIFHKFDKSGDGFIDAKELRAALERGGKKVSNEDVRDLIANVDTNYDSKLDLAEFTLLYGMAPDKEQGGCEVS